MSEPTTTSGASSDDAGAAGAEAAALAHEPGAAGAEAAALAHEPGPDAAGAQQPSLSDLAPGDRAWVEDNLARGAEMGVDLEDPASLEELFDGALDDVRIGAQQPGIRNDVIGVVACNLGELLARRHGFAWHKYRDAGGYELCLHDHRSGWVLMPISAVGKRWDNGDTGWIRGFADSVAAELAADDNGVADAAGE